MHGRESDGARKRGMVNSQNENGRLHLTSVRILGNEGNQADRAYLETGAHRSSMLHPTTVEI